MTSHRWRPLPTAHSSLGAAAAVPASVCAATSSTADEVAHRTFKTAVDPMKIGSDIANISGATLSRTHVADGVRRLVAWTVKHRVGAKAAA